MKKIFLTFFFAVAFACTPGDRDSQPSGPVKVKIPLITASGSYEMRTVQLNTVENLKVFSGSSAQFFYAPSNEGKEFKGIRPSVRLGRDGDGVYFPLDMLSLQVVSIYYHSEKLREFDKAVSLENATRWPKTIVVNAQIEQADAKHNNAYFWPEMDAMIFVPYTLSNLPISVNAGVIGHEHFHAIFEKYVEKSLREQGVYKESDKDKYTGEKTNFCKGTEGKKKYLAVLMRALNEGLADVWGWLYSGDTRFVERSLSNQSKPDDEVMSSEPLCGRGSQGASRDLNSPVKGPLESCECIDRKLTEIESNSKQNGRDGRGNSLRASYQIGARVAQVVKQFVTGGDVQVKTFDAADRSKVAAGLVAGIAKIQKRIAELKDDEWVSPSELVSLVTQEMPVVTPESCSYLQSKIGGGDRIRICGSEKKP